MWLPTLSAVLGIVAFLPFNFYLAAFIFLVPLFIFFLREEKLWRMIMGAVLFRLLFSLGTVYFTLEPILWVSSLLIFCGLPIIVWLIKKIPVRFLTPVSCSCLLLTFLPFAWTFFDLVQAHYSLAPIYIAAAGNALGSSPFLGLAVVGGFVSLTFFVAVINALVAALITWRPNLQVARDLFIAIVALVFFGWQISNLELQRNAFSYAALPNSISIAVVSTSDTFTSDSFPEIVQELANRKVDLIIFPENMSGRTTSRHDEFQNLSRELHTNVIAAYNTLQGTKKYNSAVLFDAEGNIAGVHNKNRLTFAGEYWPFGNWQPWLYRWLREKNPKIGTYAIFNPKNADTPGERNLLSATFGGNAVLFAAPICLEIHYPADLKKYQEDGAKFIVNPTSNRWIGEGIAHFLYLTNNLKKIEAVWLKLPIISSGVNDFAGITLPNGQTNLLPYQTGDKNYSIFFGTIRY